MKPLRCEVDDEKANPASYDANGTVRAREHERDELIPALEDDVMHKGGVDD